MIQENHAKLKNQPPLARNMPSVAGNIGWAWHLLKRMTEPMQKFHGNPQAFKGNREVRCLTRTHNEMANTIVKFKLVWHTAWTASIEQARSVLQATLIVRYIKDGKYYVNFDWEILQLLPETSASTAWAASRSRRPPG